MKKALWRYEAKVNVCVFFVSMKMQYERGNEDGFWSDK